MDKNKRLELEALRQDRLRELAEKRNKLNELRTMREGGGSTNLVDDKLNGTSTAMEVDKMLEALLASRQNLSKSHKKTTVRRRVAEQSVEPVKSGAAGESYEKGVQYSVKEESANGKVNVGGAELNRRDWQGGSDMSDAESENITPTGGNVATNKGLVGSDSMGSNEKENRQVESIEAMLSSEGFSTFLNKAAGVVERSLFSKDVLSSIGLFEENPFEATTHGTSSSLLKNSLQRFGNLICEETRHRPVTCMQAAPHKSGAFAVAYGPKNSQSSPGVVAVWSLSRGAHPEALFTASSPVSCVSFLPDQPHLLAGGLMNGGVILWDVRARRSIPVLRSPLHAHAHAHQVVHVTSHNHGLMSVSAEGKLCTWRLNLLASPESICDLKRGTPARDVNVSCAVARSNELYVGGEDGCVGFTSLVESFSTQKQTTAKQVTDFGDMHDAGVTSLSLHPRCAEQPILSDILLSTSMDWSIGLHSNGGTIWTMDAGEDIIANAQWHPLCASIFAAIECNGNLQLWDLAESFEAPSLQWDGDFVNTTRQVNSLLMNKNKNKTIINNDTEKAIDSGSGGFPASKLCWSRDGQQLLVGDLDGNVHCLMFNEMHSALMAKNDADHLDRFVNKVNDYKQLHIQQQQLQQSNINNPTSTLNLNSAITENVV